MAQLSYSIDIPAASFPGQLADSTRNKVQTAISALGPIAYGTLVCLDKVNSLGQDMCGRAPVGAGDLDPKNVLGIALSDQARAQNPGITGGPAYEQGVAVSCLYSGKVYVVPEQAVANGDPVYVRYTLDSGVPAGVLGGFSNAAGAGLGLLANAVFRSSAAQGGYAVLSINEA